MGATVRLERIVYLIAIMIAGLLLGMFFYLAPQVFVADSEFWSISLGYYLKDEIIHHWVYSRPLFYFLLWLSQPSYQSASESVYWARGLFSLNALLMLFLMVKIMHRRSGSYLYGVVAMVLLLGNTGFLNQGFRVRSDLLATTLALLGIYFYQRIGHKWFILSPLLATPKALLHVVSLLPVYFKNIDFYKKKKFLLLLLAAIGLVLFLNWNSLIYFISSFESNSGGPGYFEPRSFSHVKNQLFRNPLFWVLFLARFYTWKKVRNSQSAQDKSSEDMWVKVTLYFLFSMLLFTEKVQFFIASFLPYFAMHGSMFFADLKLLGKVRIKAALMATSCVTALATGAWWTSVNLQNNSNRAQLSALDNLYSYMVSANIKSFEDFNCLIPPYCAVRKFIGPHQTEANMANFETFKKSPAQVFYYLKKAELLEPQLGIFLAENYIALGRGIFILKNEYVDIPESLRGMLDVTPVNFGYLFGYDIEY